MPRLLSSFRAPRRQARAGVALILALALIVLVTTVLLIFFNYATANRLIENSRSSQVTADQVSRSGADYVVGEFLQEISSTANSTALTQNNEIVYRPINSTNIAPIRSISSDIGATDSNFASLIRQSIPSADPNASSDSTATASSNGRVISLARWNSPSLLVGSGFSSATQVPNWIYFDKTKGATGTPTVPANVIGRFAFNVYDIGGLLDANVAGFPTGEIVGNLKGTVAGADLTQLGVTQSSVDALTSGFSDPGAGVYTNRVTAFSQVGFLLPSATYTNSFNGSTTSFTKSYFMNRQELLRYVQTVNPGLTGALPYLTTFSRAVNAPSWGPKANAPNTSYLTSQDSTTSTNRFIPNVRYAGTTDNSQVPNAFAHYRDDGTYTVNYVSAGDPLVQRRFSLAKLAWLTSTGPNLSAFNPSLTSAQIQTAIISCFGLKWNATRALTGTTTTDPCWDYVGSDNGGASTPLSSIETLSGTVSPSSHNREPNFFELLKAGILSGSLGKDEYATPNPPSTGFGYTFGGIEPDIRNTDYQIIRIGANIIDQYKSDGYPTAIAFDNPAVIFWGIQDLPYFDAVFPYVREGPGSTPPAAQYILYQIWNPHAMVTRPAGFQMPTHFRVRIATGGTFLFLYTQMTTDPSPTRVTTYPYNPPGAYVAFTAAAEPPVTYTVNGSSTSSQVSYREPHLIRDVSSLVPAVQCSATSLPAPDNPSVYPQASGSNYEGILQSTVFVLDYQAANGSYYPFTTFLGHEENGGATGISNNSHFGMQADPSYPVSATSIYASAFRKEDPRTFRFDAHWQGGFDTPLWASGAVSTSSAFNYLIPSFLGTAAGRPAYLASNNSGNVNGFYPDVDGVIRPGDDYYGTVNPYSTSSSYRPVVLNHPFTSVADMGYAFRDLPFKTLDFFSSQSGDAALLDLFSLTDEPPITAGMVNLNTAQPLVLQSLLNGATGVSNPSAVATAFHNYAYGSGGLPAATIPQSRADLAAFLGNYDDDTLHPSDTKTNLEAPVRALASAVQTRTWNLLIDVVGQVGFYPAKAGAPFIVEGEKRYWLSIAIDRYTGKIVDQQLESVNE